MKIEKILTAALLPLVLNQFFVLSGESPEESNQVSTAQLIAGGTCTQIEYNDDSRSCRDLDIAG